MANSSLTAEVIGWHLAVRTWILVPKTEPVPPPEEWYRAVRTTLTVKKAEAPSDGWYNAVRTYLTVRVKDGVPPPPPPPPPPDGEFPWVPVIIAGGAVVAVAAVAKTKKTKA